MPEDDLVFDRSDPEPTNLVPAPGDEIEPVLVELGTGLFALTHPTPAFGRSNIGLIIDDDGITVVDTSATPYRGKVLRSRIEHLTSDLGLPIKRVVLTSSRVPFSGGSAAFWRAAFYGSSSTSDELDQPLNRAALRALLPDLAPAYHSDFETRPVTHTVAEQVWLTPSARLVPVIGEAPQNLVVEVPGVNGLFAGATASFGVTPLAFAGDPAAWAGALDQIAETGPTIVPGHGSVGGRQDLLDQASYLRACVAASGEVDSMAEGPWEGWTNREFDAVNIERAGRLAVGDRQIPRAMFDLLGLT